ncbi:MAG: GxxExxY protein [Prevotella sp.]|nr:GxxExxY protein [Prevotella sp.]
MFLYREESDKILGAFFEINKHLPRGLLEAVYEKAMVYELRQCGLMPDEQKQLIVKYKGMKIGYYKPDIVVNDKIILELKATKHIAPEHKAQLLNYLAITGIKVGYILNFSGDRDYCRIVL